MRALVTCCCVSGVICSGAVGSMPERVPMPHSSTARTIIKIVANLICGVSALIVGLAAVVFAKITGRYTAQHLDQWPLKLIVRMSHFEPLSWLGKLLPPLPMKVVIPHEGLNLVRQRELDLDPRHAFEPRGIPAAIPEADPLINAQDLADLVLEWVEEKNIGSIVDQIDADGERVVVAADNLVRAIRNGTRTPPGDSTQQKNATNGFRHIVQFLNEEKARLEKMEDYSARIRAQENYYNIVSTIASTIGSALHHCTNRLAVSLDDVYYGVLSAYFGNLEAAENRVSCQTMEHRLKACLTGCRKILLEQAIGAVLQGLSYADIATCMHWLRRSVGTECGVPYPASSNEHSHETIASQAVARRGEVIQQFKSNYSQSILQEVWDQVHRPIPHDQAREDTIEITPQFFTQWVQDNVPDAADRIDELMYPDGHPYAGKWKKEVVAYLLVREGVLRAS